MQLEELYKRALNFEYLTKEEGMFLFENAPLAELSYCLLYTSDAADE